MALYYTLSARAIADDFPPVNIYVQGQQVGVAEIRELQMGILTAHLRTAQKTPKEMPVAAPLAYYAGRGVVWISTALHQDLGTFSIVSPANQPGEDAFVAAVSVAAIEAGTVGDPWLRMYRSAPDDSSRIRLGTAIAQGLKDASDQSQRFAVSESDWMKTHIVTGITRSDAYALVRSRHLTVKDGTQAPAEQHPDAVVAIYGAFGLGCSESMYTTIQFNDADRVQSVTVKQGDGSCI